MVPTGKSYIFSSLSGTPQTFGADYFLGDRIMDLEKWAFGMWAFIAHGGLSKPTVGFHKYGGHFSEKKKCLGQRSWSFKASNNPGFFLYKT